MNSVGRRREPAGYGEVRWEGQSIEKGEDVL